MSVDEPVLPLHTPKVLLLSLALLALALVSSPASAADQDPDDVDPGIAMQNTRETSHRVEVKLIDTDVAVFSVVREFEAHKASEPMRLDGNFDVPDQAVVTSFAIQTDGAWRRGRLGVHERLTTQPAQEGARRRTDRPWASLRSDYPSLRLDSASWRTDKPTQVRYTLWAQAQGMQSGLGWSFCTNGVNEVRPSVVLAPSASELRVHVEQVGKHGSCTSFIKPEPPRTALVARYGRYSIARNTWWWRIEVAMPEALHSVARPHDVGPVVFVLDASRSQERRGGIAAQLAIVRAFLSHTPRADVELIVTNREATRVFGRFVSALAFERALPRNLTQTPLKNGSFLDRGVDLAVEALVATGKPGRIVLMTDGQLRKRFNQASVIVALKRAVSGTLVHMVYPSSEGNDAISFYAPEGLGEIPAALGGASYGVSVGTKPDKFSPPLTDHVRRLVYPEQLESIELHSAFSSDERWPPDGLLWDDTLKVGQRHVWSGSSKRPPPRALSLTGWVWGEKMTVRLDASPAFERRLPRLDIFEDAFRCASSTRHRDQARRAGFLVPGLVFHVPGYGAMAEEGDAGGYDPCYPGGHLGGSHRTTAKPNDAFPDVKDAFARCQLVAERSSGAAQAGQLQVEIETTGSEILDVSIAGGNSKARRCAEEALWALRLPNNFNAGNPSWRPAEYSLTLESAR